jgi:hypothetical protein
MNRLRALLERLRQLKLSPLQGWQRTAAWAGLGVFLFTFFLAVTFPYDAVRACPAGGGPGAFAAHRFAGAGLPGHHRPGSGVPAGSGDSPRRCV